VDERKKIVHIQVLPILSGVQRAMLDLLIRLDPADYDISVICSGQGALTETLTEHSIRWIALPELARSINPYYDVIAFLKLYKLLKRHKFDLVHTHSSKPGVIGRLAARAAGVKAIVHTVQGFAFHENSTRLKKLFIGIIERIAGLACHMVVFVNDKDLADANELKIVPAGKTIKICNGVDVNAFCHGSNGANNSENNKIASEKYVGMIARLWEQKAPEYFIAAIPEILKEVPDAKFLVIGDGPLKSDLLQLSKKLQVDKSVRFLGWRQDVPSLLKRMDVYVLPSLWEGLPISILEAMCAGKPVVATNIKGNNELVMDGDTGFLVEPKNAAQISAAVVKLLKNRKLAEKMGQSGRKRVESHFDIKETVRQTENLYLRLLSSVA